MVSLYMGDVGTPLKLNNLWEVPSLNLRVKSITDMRRDVKVLIILFN